MTIGHEGASVPCIDCIDLKEKIKRLNTEIGEIRNQWHIDLNDKVALQAENKQLKEAMERRKPKHLFFGKLQLLGFKVMVCKEVPDNQIWFATDEQLKEALEFSKEQFEKALKEK